MEEKIGVNDERNLGEDRLERDPTPWFLIFDETKTSSVIESPSKANAKLYSAFYDLFRAFFSSGLWGL